MRPTVPCGMSESSLFHSTKSSTINAFTGCGCGCGCICFINMGDIVCCTTFFGPKRDVRCCCLGGVGSVGPLWGGRITDVGEGSAVALKAIEDWSRRRRGVTSSADVVRRRGTGFALRRRPSPLPSPDDFLCCATPAAIMPIVMLLSLSLERRRFFSRSFARTSSALLERCDAIENAEVSLLNRVDAALSFLGINRPARGAADPRASVGLLTRFNLFSTFSVGISPRPNIRDQYLQRKLAQKFQPAGCLGKQKWKNCPLLKPQSPQGE